MAAFRFSEDDWKKISEVLQGAGLIVPENDYEPARMATPGAAPARLLLEHIIDFWLLMSDGNAAEKSGTACLEILKAIESLRAAIDSSDVGRRLTDSQFLGALNSLHHKGMSFLQLIEEGPRRSKNLHRDLLITDLLLFWETCGGEARTSTASDNTPSGPLIRFLITVTSSLNICLTPNAARKLVRTHREVRKEQYGVKSIEEAYKKMRTDVA
jgi:hypothetical protein